MGKYIEKVTAYMDHLIEREGLYVFVHLSEKMYELANEDTLAALLPYRSHNNPYCRSIHCSNPLLHERCKENNRQIMRELRDKDRVVHTCYAAATEVAYPLCHNGEAVGFVSVSGYKGGEGERYDGILWTDALSSDEIPLRLTDTLIPPLCLMLEKVLPEQEDERGEINDMLKYISNSPIDVSLEKIARKLGRSNSYVSHLFKKKTGRSLRAYCNDLKLLCAEKLLRSTDMPVTEIALESGFEDTSYFIRLFREKYGQTPYKYKKNHLTSKNQHSIIKEKSKGDKKWE